MKCETCKGEAVVYELFPRSYRLYVYACLKCEQGFLAHHFDIDLEIYKLKDLEVKQNGSLVFISGLKAEPRVFDFKVNEKETVVVIADKEVALGEVALKKKLFAGYSERALKRLRRHLKLANATEAEIAGKLLKMIKEGKDS